MAYSRIFITLNQCCKDYAKDIRGCVGKCVIEIRNGFGRFVLQVQGLNSEASYRTVILGSTTYTEVKKPLYIDGSGKGEIRWSFSPEELSFATEDIRAVAVLVMDKAPLIGFTKGEYNWQSALMARDIRVAEAKEAPTEVISIIEEFGDNIKDIKNIIESDNVSYIFSRENVKPFGEDNIKWVRAELKELSVIKDLWKYINNPYVIHCYCTYKYILIGRENDNYIMALPCKYDKSYVLEAKLQGFKGYKAPAGKELRDNEFCYCILTA